MSHQKSLKFTAFTTRTILNSLTIGALIFAFFYHLYIIYRTSVNIPYWDEWEMLKPLSLDTKLNFSWLWRQHFDHRIVLTKFYTWILYFFDGWNVRHNLVYNFLIYGLIIYLIIKIKNLVAKTMPFWAFGFSLIFTLSPLPFESHTWAFESQYHFVLILSFLQIIFLNFPTQTRTRYHSFANLCGILSMITLASGLVTFAAILFFFALSIFLPWHYRDTKNVETARLKQKLRALLLSGFWFFMILAFWVFEYHAPDNLPQKTSPLKWKVWDFYLNLISYGFGYQIHSWKLGAVCLLIIIVPFLVLFYKTRKLLDDFNWIYLTVTFTVLISLVVVAIGRTSWGIDTSKTSRYVEFSALLIPLACIGWWKALNGHLIFQYISLSFIITIATIGYLDDWNFDQYYKVQASRQIGYNCVLAYYQNHKEPFCPQISDQNLSSHLELAKRLNLSFYRESLMYTPTRSN